MAEQPTPSPRPPAAPELGDWWDAVSTCALIGTGRRPVPDPPLTLVAALGPVPSGDPPTGAEHPHPETRLLDQIAVGMAWRTGSPEALTPERLDPAPEETLPLAPARALQLLELVLAQAPAGAAATDSLVADWVDAARERGMRVPPPRQPPPPPPP